MNNLGNLVKRNKTILTISMISGLVFLFWSCIVGSSDKSIDPRGRAYAGSQTCIRCHPGISDIYQHSSHFRTSGPVKNLHANWFSKDPFPFNDSVAVSVEKRDSGIFQVEYVNSKQALAKPFEVGIGSGDDAVSFAYWQDKKMYQLPLTYFTAISGWANSPGFPSHAPYFFRPIVSRCLECHGSFISEAAQQDEGLTAIKNLDKRSVIYGIDCERCHGPAANHVNFHTKNPDAKAPMYMASWKSLSRQQNLDVCAMCHSGNDIAMQQPTFWFKPGDTLSNYYFPFSGGSAKPDVHGKQYQLLTESRCFQMSKTMECTSCHSPHKPEPANLVINSSSCIGCHKKETHLDCSVASSLPPSLQNNCVSCHMPDMASNKISIQSADSQNGHPYLLRTHKIAIYPEVSKKMLADWKNSKQIK